MPPKKKPVNVSNKTKSAIVTVRKSSRTTPVKNKEKVSNSWASYFHVIISYMHIPDSGI